MKKITVLGSGSWGTALAAHLAQAGHPVSLWARRAELAERMALDRVNEEYLPGVELPPRLEPTADLGSTTASDLTLVVVPSHGFREVVADYLALLPDGEPAILVSATKGIEAEGLARMSEVMSEECARSGHPIRFAVLAGPSFASELARGKPTVAVMASRDAELAQMLRGALSTPTLRLYSSTDVIGVELAGTAKNVIAIAAGVTSGLELGHNTLAALITRGLHEITRLGVAAGGDMRTFPGLAGLGDLVLTCTGGPSRNRRTGIALAEGKTLEEITGATSMVAEGVRNSRAIASLAQRLGVEMPITAQVVKILYEGGDPRRAVADLMTRALKTETAL